MFTTTFSGELINVALRQLGATRIVETRNGIMYKVEFKLSDDLTVTYVFDVTKHDKYYIQRIAPYPISHGDFASADEVIEFVRRDITKFRNAMQSHNFPKFLETAHAMVRFTHAVELMFLERNIPEEDIPKIFMPLLSTAMISTPNSVPVILPRPPFMLVPPRATAAIASSS